MGASVSQEPSSVRADDRPRVPCPQCGAPIIEGALKCRACKRWLVDPPQPRPPSRAARSFTLLAAAVVAVAAVLISQRPSPVGEAPPLTPLSSSSVAGSAKPPAARAGSPTAHGTLRTPDGDDGGPADARSPEAEPAAEPPGDWRTTVLPIDVHPLDLVLAPSGKSVYVSGDDASLLEYELDTGKVLHLAKMPAQGDRLRLLANRYLAVIPHLDAGHIPLLDTHHWERDPVLLEVGANPADILALPDGRTAVSASSRGKRLSWFDLGRGRRLANIRLPHATRHLFVVRAEGRPYVGAMGQLLRAGQPAGAWLDLFDPSETPFGATRRSISVGREPRPGAVSADGASIFLADRVSNTASLVWVDGTTEARSVSVGQGPVGAFLMGEDRFGVTINGEARTATVIALERMVRVATLMLPGQPNFGATDERGRVLFVSLGGPAWPPSGSGAVVIAGDPPKVVAVLDTGKGAARIAVDVQGTRAAVANYWGRSLTVVQR